MKVVWFELETRAVGQNETNELGSSLGWPKLGIKHEKQLYTDCIKNQHPSKHIF